MAFWVPVALAVTEVRGVNPAGEVPEPDDSALEAGMVCVAATPGAV